MDFIKNEKAKKEEKLPGFAETTTMQFTDVYKNEEISRCWIATAGSS